MIPLKSSTSNTISGDELSQSLTNFKISLRSFAEKLDRTCAEVESLLNDINYQVGLLTRYSTPSQSKDVNEKKEPKFTTDLGPSDEKPKNKENLQNAGEVFDEHQMITKSNPENPRKGEERKDGKQTSPLHSNITGKHCFLCNAAATLKCEICFQADASLAIDIPYYCGEDHQNLHLTLGHNSSCGKDALKLGWKEIRDTEGINNCLPFYVATRELEAGEEIFTKKPLFSFPKMLELHDVFNFRQQFRELFSYVSANKIDFETCIICHEMMPYGLLMEDPLHGIRLNKCPNCGWPVHSSRDVNIQKVQMNSCQEEHAEECKIFMDNQLTWNKINEMEKFMWLYLGVLRVVMNPVLRQKLLNTPSSPCGHFRGIRKFVMKDCKQSQVSKDEVEKIIHVLVSKSFPSYAGYFSMWKKYNYTIYEGGSIDRILPHSCNPNCSIHVNPKTGEATFKTCRKVKKNEMLTINYMVDSFPQPIYYRALSLIKKSPIYHCKCDKCKDGHDLTSAVKRLQGPKSPKHLKVCKISKYLLPFSTRPQEKTGNQKQSKSLRSEEGTSSILRSNQTQRNANKSAEVTPDTSNLYIWQCPSCKSLGPRVEQSVVQAIVERIREELKHGVSEDPRKDFMTQYDKVKEIIKKYSDKELHPAHCLMILAQVALGYFIVWKIRMKSISTDEKDRSDLHAYFPDLDKAIQMLDRNDNGRSETYGTLLYGHTLLEMSRFTEKISSRKNKPTFSEMKTSLQPIMTNLKKSWEIMKDNPYLSAVEINRDIQLFELYAKDLEMQARGLVDSPKESIFETFRTEQIKRIQSKSALPSGSWYLYEAKSEGNQDSLLKKTTTSVSRSHEGQTEKIEFQEETNTISGAFIRELFFDAAYEHF